MQGAGKRITALLASAGLLIAGGVTAGSVAAPKKPKPVPVTKGNPTLQATPNPIRFGTATALSGKLSGNGNSPVAVTLQADAHPFEGSFADLANATTANNGNYKFDGVRPGRNTQFRVRAATSPPKFSDALLVRVAISVRLGVSDSSPDRGERVTFSGTAKPAHDGAIVNIQRRQADGSYKTLATTTLKDAGTDRSTYEKGVRISTSGLYRVKVPGDADHASGFKKRTIEVEQ